MSEVICVSSELTSMLRREKEVVRIWESIFKHPFVIELYSGSLPLDKFKYYVKQDYNYLIGMMRAYSLLAAKADYYVAKKALEIAYSDATIEMEAYIRLLDELGMTLDEVINTDSSPTNEAYMNFLINICSLGTPLECLVSTLPCFWTYLEIAEKHKELLRSNKQGIYVKWCKTYLSEDYKKLLLELRRLIDELWSKEKGDYRKLLKLFIKASKYEWMFWDAAYRMESWPI